MSFSSSLNSCSSRTCQQEKEFLEREINLYKNHMVRYSSAPPNLEKDVMDANINLIRAQREHLGCAEKIDSLREQIAELQVSASSSSVAPSQEQLSELLTLKTSLEAVKAELEESRKDSREKQASIHKLTAERLVQKTRQSSTGTSTNTREQQLVQQIELLQQELDQARQQLDVEKKNAANTMSKLKAEHNKKLAELQADNNAKAHTIAELSKTDVRTSSLIQEKAELESELEVGDKLIEQWAAAYDDVNLLLTCFRKCTDVATKERVDALMEVKTGSLQ
ncbi:hypothetical protein H2198_001611 [Neophaeococcomyces mojaviensis]|uniref:Uncharacterized protein n=1 Tax=Neophaeococcomyces mojaviensis TaxID=3383035 RepID=A0ACC3AGK2_9EURO|nr:hypothetical protein H2198_001611 [Knufia sp. JES_112]